MRAFVPALLILALPGDGGASPTWGLVWRSVLVVWIVGELSLARRTPSTHDPALGLLAGVVVVASLVALVRGPYAYGAWLTVVEILAFVAVALLAARSPVAPAALAPWLVGAAGIETVVMAIRFFTRDDVVRPAGTFFNPNHAGAWLAMVALLQLGRLLDARRRPTALGWAGLAVPVAGLAWTQSRGALLGFCAAGVVLWLMRRRGASRRVRRLATTALGGATLLAGAVVAQRFATDDPFRFHRVRIWAGAATVALERPWLGVGPGQFADAAEAVRFADGVGAFRYDRRFSTTHSDLLQLPVQFGLPVAALVAAIAVVLARRVAVRRRREGLPRGADGALAALVAWTVQSGVDNLAERPAIYLLAATLIGTLASRERPEPPVGLGRGRTRWVLAAVVLVGWAVGEWAPYRSWQLREAARADREPGLLREAARRNPLDPEVAILLAETPGSLADARAYAAAREAYERAIRLRPTSAALRRRAARLEARACLGLFPTVASRERADRRFEEAAERAPFDVGIAIEHARFLLDADDPAGARRQAERALRLEPNAARAILLLARVAAEEGRIDDARERLGEARRRSRDARASAEAAAEGRRYAFALAELPPDQLERVESLVGGAAR